MRVSWERLGGVLGVLGCVLAVLVVLGRQHFRFFPNSGTLKGSSRLFKESQGVPASVPESGRSAAAVQGIARSVVGWSSPVVGRSDSGLSAGSLKGPQGVENKLLHVFSLSF